VVPASQLDQPQKFRPSLLLSTPVRISGAAISFGNGPARLVLAPESRVEKVARDPELQRFCTWDRAAAAERLRSHEASPLDLDVELEEEIVLQGWSLGQREPEQLGERHVYPLTAGGVEYTAVVSDGAEGEALGKALERLRHESAPPPLFALLHCELGRLIVRPLSLLDGGWPTHLMLGKSRSGARALYSALKSFPTK
jgi:hypothetical protein